MPPWRPRGWQPSHQAHREVGLDEAPDDRRRGLLGGGDDVDARLPPPLQEPGQRPFHPLTSHQHQVGQFVYEEETDGQGGRRQGGSPFPGLPVSLSALHLHQPYQALESLGGLVGVGDDGAGQVGEGFQVPEGAPLGVHKDHSEGVGRVEVGQGEGHSPQQSGLAAAGGAGDEDVGNVGGGEADEKGGAVVGDAQEGGGKGDVAQAAEEGKEADRAGVLPGDLHGDEGALAGDADGGGAQGDGQFLGKAGEGADAGAYGGEDVVADPAGVTVPPVARAGMRCWASTASIRSA